MVTVRKYGRVGAKWYFSEAKQNTLLSLHNSFFFLSFYYYKKRKSHQYLWRSLKLFPVNILPNQKSILKDHVNKIKQKALVSTCNYVTERQNIRSSIFLSLKIYGNSERAIYKLEVLCNESVLTSGFSTLQSLKNTQKK